MRAGDILLLPRGAPHIMHSLGKTVEPSTPRLASNARLPLYRIGGASIDLDMLCGGFHYNRTSILP
jgi:AraC family transcriptional activator of mtrCDE